MRVGIWLRIPAKANAVSEGKPTVRPHQVKPARAKRKATAREDAGAWQGAAGPCLRLGNGATSALFVMQLYLPSRVRQNGVVDVPGKLRSLWSAMQEWRAGKHFEIQCDDYGVTLAVVPARGEPPLRLTWERIDAVYAYKRDCLTVDQIRILLGNDDQRTWMEVSEDDIGFKVLITELARRLPGCPSIFEWWEKVALPPFETQWTEVYRRVGPQDCSPSIERA
jgi:hypothetical protein